MAGAEIRARCQQRKITRALRAKTKIIADQEMPHIQMPRQNVIAKSQRILLGKTPIERLNDHMIKTFASEVFKLFTQAGKPGRRQCGREEFTRMRLERHQSRLQSALSRHAFQLGQNGGMATMQTVEIPDRQGNRRKVGVMNAAIHAHRKQTLKKHAIVAADA